MRRASAVSIAPQALKNSLVPPNVAAPKLKRGTVNPDAPSRRYSTNAPNPKLQILRRANADDRHTE
jgi:hypothetical protein